MLNFHVETLYDAYMKHHSAFDDRLDPNFYIVVDECSNHYGGSSDQEEAQALADDLNSRNMLKQGEPVLSHGSALKHVLHMLNGFMDYAGVLREFGETDAGYILNSMEEGIENIRKYVAKALHAPKQEFHEGVTHS